MVPGWTMPAWIFDAQIAAFSQPLPRDRLRPALAGRQRGRRRPATIPWRRGQDIAELLDQLGPDPVLLMGWSLGVLDSLAYVHSYGDRRLAGLVLVDNSVGEDPPPQPGAGASGRPARAEAVARGADAPLRRRHVPPSAAARLARPADRGLPAHAAGRRLGAAAPIRCRGRFWKEAVYSTAQPVLYVVRPNWAGQAANLAAHHPNAETVVMDGVGHALFVDDPARFDALVEAFIHRRVWP